MVVQASVERHLLAEAQTSTRDVLFSIEQTGRETLVELRRLLGVLRKSGNRPELAPQPSVSHLDLLVEAVGEAGLPVSLSIEGEPVLLAAGLDLSAYRIVQEALTNALKHAGPAHADVTVRYRASGLELEVRDDGPGTGDGGGSGHGLIGMRERVDLYGGTLETGAQPGGGYLVRVHLPLEPAHS
jgi:signal transduction histidine kinase